LARWIGNITDRAEPLKGLTIVQPARVVKASYTRSTVPIPEIVTAIAELGVTHHVTRYRPTEA